MTAQQGDHHLMGDEQMLNSKMGSLSFWEIDSILQLSLPIPGLVDVMIKSTTSTIEGRPVQQYLGLVTGEAIIGANVFRDIFAGIRDFVGGRSGSYEKVLADARKAAVGEMELQAQELGANAVIGIDLDYEVLGAQNGMLMVTACGTAVKI